MTSFLLQNAGLRDGNCSDRQKSKPRGRTAGPRGTEGGPGGPGGVFQRHLHLSAPGGEKGIAEHNPKFWNGEQNDCQHLLAAWKSSWAAYNSGTSSNHQDPGSESGSDKDERKEAEGKRGEREGGTGGWSVAISGCWNTVTAALDRLVYPTEE